MVADMTQANITTPEHIEYVLRLGDNALILGQRLSEWCGHAPVIEEDLALTNMALDLIGQSRLLLTHAAALEGKGRDEDQMAFLRVEREYRNVTMMEVPNEDFGRTTVRNFLFSAFQVLLWERLGASSDAELAARKSAWAQPEKRFERGYGWMFSQHILQADKGCDFDYLETAFGRPIGEPDIF